MVWNEKQVAIVTGGGSGIGRALCLALGQRGVTVVAVDVNEQGVQQTVEQMRAAGQEAQSACVDVSDRRQVQALVDRVVTQHSRLDLMINNAGVAMVAEMLDMTMAQWETFVAVNLWGVIYGTDAAYRVMAKQGSGHIVNVASGAGLAPAPYRVAYTTTKHAVVGLSTTLRYEAAAYGVKVSVVCPGTVRTPIFQNVQAVGFDPEKIDRRLNSQKMTEPAEAARIILRGVDRNQGIITFPALMNLLWWLYRLSPAGMEKTLLKRYAEDYRKMRAV